VQMRSRTICSCRSPAPEGTHLWASGLYSSRSYSWHARLVCRTVAEDGLCPCSNQEFRYQLRGECSIDTPWEAFAVSGHGAWRLDESHTRIDPDGLGQARCERHGVVDISYALSFIPDEPVIPIVPLVPPEETGSDSDEPEWPVVPLVPPKD
jgi:hypothetical protein